MKPKPTQYRVKGAGGFDFTVSLFGGIGGVIHLQDDNNPKMLRKLQIVGAGGNLSFFPFSLDISTESAPAAGTRVYRGLKHTSPMTWGKFGGPGVILMGGAAIAFGTGGSGNASAVFFGMQGAYIPALLGSLGALSLGSVGAVVFPAVPIASLVRESEAQAALVGLGAHYGFSDVGVMGAQIWVTPL